MTTNNPVTIAEDYAMTQYMPGGQIDLMTGRGTTGSVYPWFGKDIRNGIPLTIDNYALLRRWWSEDNVDWHGTFRTPLRKAYVNFLDVWHFLFKLHMTNREIPPFLSQRMIHLYSITLLDRI